MNFDYEFNDAQSLLGSLDSQDDQFQLTSNNLYQNEGFWSNNDAANYGLNNVQIKQEHISPESLNNQTNFNSNDDQLLNDIINFDEFGNPKKEEDDDIDSQLDELINSSTQVPTPVSSSSSVTESPLDPKSSMFVLSNPSRMANKNIAGKISKPKKSRSTHNLIEKKYRTNINSKIMDLRDAVPSLRIASDANQETTIDDLEGLTPASKLNKASILTKATEYIKHLETKNEMLTNDVFQLRSILSQFQQMIPQVLPHHQQPQSQNPINQSPPVTQHQQQQQQQIYPSSSNLSSPQQLPIQQQSSTPPQPQPPIHSHSQQSFTDQVNMGLNGFVPTLSQIQAAQLQLQNMQHGQLAPRSQQQQHQQADGTMSFGNKVLVGGMTALLGSQMFIGGSDGGDGFDYKGLSFIPIHKLLPLINSELGQFFIQFLKLSMVLFGAFTILEPVLFMILSTFSQDENDKKQPVYKQESSLSISKSYLEVFAIKLGFKDQINDFEEISQFNKKAASTLSNCLAEKVKTYNGWKKVLILFAQIENFAIPDLINEKDKLKKNEIISILLEFTFTKLIFAKLLSVKLGSIFGLNKTVDTAMLKIIKLMRLADDGESLTSENSKQIFKLINNDTEFIDSVALYEGLCDLFCLDKENFFKSLFILESSKPSLSLPNPILNNVHNLINSCEDLSIVNLVITIRCQQILDTNLVKYTKLLVTEDESDGSANTEEEESAADDTDIEDREEILDSIYKEIIKFEKLIPSSSLELTKSFKFYKVIVKPNLNDLNEIVEIVKHEACELIDYSDTSLQDSKDAKFKTKDAQISKILKFTSVKNQFSKQHLSNLSPLISEENYLLLTCSFILYYHSINKSEECIQLNRFLKINHDLSLLSFIALFEASNILIDQLLKKENTISKSITEISKNSKEEIGGDDDDGDDSDGSSSSTITLNSARILESKIKLIEYYKSNIEQLILKSRLLIAQSGSNFNSVNQLHRLNLGLKSEVSDRLVNMGKRINGYA